MASEEAHTVELCLTMQNLCEDGSDRTKTDSITSTHFSNQNTRKDTEIRRFRCETSSVVEPCVQSGDVSDWTILGIRT